MNYLYKYLHLLINSGQNLWDIIVIIIIFDLLYKYFDIITINLLEISNKMID